jgi:hypothetical protein
MPRRDAGRIVELFGKGPAGPFFRDLISARDAVSVAIASASASLRAPEGNRVKGEFSSAFSRKFEHGGRK